MCNIAIFGATSIIAKEFVQECLAKTNFTFDLFSRNSAHMYVWLENLQSGNDQIKIKDYDGFNQNCSYDVIINFIGRGDPKRLQREIDHFSVVNDYFDIKILSYLLDKPKCKYIYMSSGAAYLNNFQSPVKADDILNITFNTICDYDVYSVTKFLTEARHRKQMHLNIVDVRIFNYVQKIDILSSNSFISEIFQKTITGASFITSKEDLKRDYIDSELFYHGLKSIIAAPPINCALDFYSAEPITKWQLLDHFSRYLSLDVQIDSDLDLNNFNITGTKPHYYSIDRALAEFGYSPDSTSKDIILKKSKEVGLAIASESQNAD